MSVKLTLRLIVRRCHSRLFLKNSSISSSTSRNCPALLASVSREVTRNQIYATDRLKRDRSGWKDSPQPLPRFSSNSQSSSTSVISIPFLEHLSLQIQLEASQQSPYFARSQRQNAWSTSSRYQSSDTMSQSPHSRWQRTK